MEQPRRLSDRIMNAHELACEQGKIDVAEALLRALEVELSQFGGAPGKDKRNSTDMLRTAFERHDKAKTTAGS